MWWYLILFEFIERLNYEPGYVPGTWVKMMNTNVHYTHNAYSLVGETNIDPIILQRKKPRFKNNGEVQDGRVRNYYSRI